MSAARISAAYSASVLVVLVHEKNTTSVFILSSSVVSGWVILSVGVLSGRLCGGKTLDELDMLDWLDTVEIDFVTDSDCTGLLFVL